MSNFGPFQLEVTSQPNLASLCLVTLRGVTCQGESWLLSGPEPSAQRKRRETPCGVLEEGWGDQSDGER